MNSSGFSGFCSNTKYASHTGATSITGKYGSAYEFDGTSNFIDIPLDSNDLTSFTISAWIKHTGHWKLSDEGAVISNFDYDGASLGIELSIENTGIKINGAIFGTRSVSIPANNWQFVALAFDGTKLYFSLDGDYIETSFTGNISNMDINTDFNIGSRPEGNLNFNGTIDEVMIFDKALSADEIQALYAQGSYKLDPVLYRTSETTQDIYSDININDFNITDIDYLVFNGGGWLSYNGTCIISSNGGCV